jgi:GTP-binding protein EngB required for normal cell division
MDKALIINEIMKIYNFRKYGDFADFLGIKQQLISNWIKRNSFDVELIYTKCEKISAEFILTGQGKIERSSEKEQSANPTEQKLIAALEKNINYLEKELNKCLAQKKDKKTGQTVDANDI